MAFVFVHMIEKNRTKCFVTISYIKNSSEEETWGDLKKVKIRRFLEC